MSLTDTTFEIDSDADEWLVMVRPGSREIRQPVKKQVLRLESGVDYLVVFYGYGVPKKKIELTVTVDGAQKIKHSESVPKGEKFAVGHDHLVV